MSEIIPLDNSTETPLLRAAQYVRMSTEHQQYSTHNQSDKIREYAQRRGIELVRTYADEGKSGLSIGGRAALQRLIADVESGAADFSFILVYDVSRWGRFQDADESAYYEYVCKRAGIQVIYVAEQFENDGSPVSTIVKGVKRAMAGEYSRELSTKVFAGQCRLIEHGFRQGGPAGFGLRRVLIDQAGNVKGTLNAGEQKSLQTDRVILCPGPEDEIRQVNAMFRWLIDEDLAIAEIAGRLNDMEVLTDRRLPWTAGTVRQVLTNEKYIGNNIYNRRSFKLMKLRVKNPPEMWIRKEAAFAGIVPTDIFLTVQERLRVRATQYTDEDLLGRVRQLHENQGRLTALIIDRAPDLPSANALSRRFGSLTKVYELVGFRPEYDMRTLELNRALRRLHSGIVQRTRHAIAELGAHVWCDPKTDLLHLNEELSVSLVLARCKTLPDGLQRWQVHFDLARSAPDITVAIRLDPSNETELDYYVLPRLNFGPARIQITERNATEFECFRFDDLNFFYGLTRRANVRSGQEAYCRKHPNLFLEPKQEAIQ